MMAHPDQSLEPLAVYCNNNCVLLEDNKLQQGARGGKLFSSFKIFKLKGPIDVNFLKDIIFPPKDGGYYEIEESEYDGESVKVKFNFSNKTHNDLIEYLKKASQSLFQVSGNGLYDWVPADKVTNKLVYGNSLNQTSLPTTDYSDDNEYPEIDEESLAAEIENLAEQIRSHHKDFSHEKLDSLFYRTFNRRDMSVTIHDIKDKFFSQLDIAQLLPGPNDVDDESLNPNHVKKVLCSLIISQLQGRISTVLPKRSIKDYKFFLAIVLWNLINTLRVIHKSYQVLKDNDAKFREILREKKTICVRSLDKMELLLADMLRILENDLEKSQFDKFQERLVDFLTLAEGLLDTIKITNVKCDDAIRALEDQEKELSTSWWVSAALVGGAAVLGTGYFAYKRYNNQEITDRERAIAAGAGVVGVAALATGHKVIGNLQGTIQRQASTLKQLRDVHDKVRDWTRSGRDLLKWDQTKMNQYRNILAPQLNQIKLQSKAFKKLFEDQGY